MKIRNHRNLEYWFFPSDNSKLLKGTCYIFKYKSDLIKFLTNNLKEAINGEVHLEEQSIGYSGCKRMWIVWYNERQYMSGAKLTAKLKQLNFRGKKYLTKIHTVSKVNKKYFAFSDKVFNLMCNLEDQNGIITPKKAKKLVQVFKKIGYVDFEPTEDDLNYINKAISSGIDFEYWSDRCNDLRAKAIIEYFNRSGLLE